MKLNVKGGTITGTAKKLVSEANSKGATTAGAGIATGPFSFLIIPFVVIP